MRCKPVFMLIGVAIAISILLKFTVFNSTTQKLTVSCNLDSCNSPSVIVLHGLVRSAASMNKMSQALNRAGYHVCNIQYPSRKYGIKQLAIDFVYPEINKCLPNTTSEINFVTHSMGGIILRQLAQTTDLKIHRAVMLSPPNQGSELVDKLKVVPLFAIINGQAGLSLGTELESVPNTLGRINFSTGIITGDRSHNLFYSYLIPGADDGKVAINRARVEGMQDFLIVPYSHSFIMNKDIVIQKTIQFLQSEKFN